MTRSRKIAAAAFAFHSLTPLGAGWIARDGIILQEYEAALAMGLLGCVDLPLAPLYWAFCTVIPWGGRIGGYGTEVAACLATSFVFGGLLHAWAAVRLDHLIARFLHR